MFLVMLGCRSAGVLFRRQVRWFPMGPMACADRSVGAGQLRTIVEALREKRIDLIEKTLCLATGNGCDEFSN
jgi:hypothetical protein